MVELILERTLKPPYSHQVNSKQLYYISFQLTLIIVLGVRIQLPSHADLANGVTQPDTSDDAKGNTFLETIEPERLWNFFTNPDTSTRRLYTNVFFVSPMTPTS